MTFENPCPTFIQLIIKNPEKAFVPATHAVQLEIYLKYFFYNEITEDSFSLSEDNLKKLKIHTYCFLLGANQFDETCLISCLNNVNLEILKNKLSENEINKIEELTDEITHLPAANTLLKLLLGNWKKLESLVGIYYYLLVETYKKLNRKIDRILVYEAPPFGKDHFFKTGGNYLASFTFCDDAQIKSRLDESVCIQENIKNAIISGIVYIDLTMIPLPLTSEIRSAWSVSEKYRFGDQQLPVLMLEWAIEKLKSRFEKGMNPFSSTCQIAIGTPINTSASIFEHYSDKLFKIDEGVYFDLTMLNYPEVFKKKKYLKGHTLKQFKFNVIDNTTPTVNFVKNAFDFPC
jgi:hypothetical protein